MRFGSIDDQSNTSDIHIEIICKILSIIFYIIVFIVYNFVSFFLGMKMTMSTGSTMTPRIHRKVIRTASKLHPGKLHPGKLHAGKRQPGKALPTKSMHGHQHQLQQTGKLITSRGKMLSRVPPLTRPIDSCDNSNDSGLGFDQIEMNSSSRNCLRYVCDVLCLKIRLSLSCDLLFSSA